MALTLPTSGRTGPLGAIYARAGNEADVAIAGIPFRLATSSEMVASTETIPVRKDQLDTENDPGEQSLAGWWRRSQTSWHEGAGSRYQEGRDGIQDSATFWDSEGVDVFTPGRLSLLRRMKVWTGAAGASNLRTFPSRGDVIRTNVCTNPSFEVSAAGWTPVTPTGSLSTTTVSRISGSVTTPARHGTSMGQISWGYAGVETQATKSHVTIPLGTMSANTLYRASLWVYLPATYAGTGVVLTSATTGIQTNSWVDGTDRGRWVELTGLFTTNGSGALTIRLEPRGNLASPTSSFYVDACIVEVADLGDDYFDGSISGASWTGTAGLSTSTMPAIAVTAVSMIAWPGAISAALCYASTPGGALTVVHDPASQLADGLISSASGSVSSPTFYDVTIDGTLCRGQVGVPATETTWPLGNTGAGQPKRLEWGKYRLWVIGGRNLWQPDLAAAGGSTQAPIFTHPNPGFTYTALAEGASAMLFGGHDGYNSVVQSVQLDTSGGVPTLSGAQTTAVLPAGELVQQLAVMAGQYVGIGTNRGFRVGVLDSSGSITYGPLIMEPPGVSACTALATQGRFFVVAFAESDGVARTYRVDLGTDLGNGTFPYAKDITCGDPSSSSTTRFGADNYVSSITAISGDRLVVSTADGYLWYQSGTEFVKSGWLETGRIRFRTLEKKQFRTIALGIDGFAVMDATSNVGNVGAVTPAVIRSDGQVSLCSSVSNSSSAEVVQNLTGATSRYVAVRLTIEAASGNQLYAPTVTSYQLQALPTVKPQRLITLPLLCYDRELARSGQQYGGEGYAEDRLEALQALEDAGAPVLYQDFASRTPTTDTGEEVIIESIRFIRTTPPVPVGRESGAGGILLLQLRTVA